MQINVLSSKYVRVLSKNILIFMLTILCSFMCMSFTTVNNDGSNKKRNVIKPTPNIAPEGFVIGPDEKEETVIGPAIENKTVKTNNKVVHTIGDDFNSTKTSNKKITTSIKPNNTPATIQPSIGPSSIGEKPAKQSHTSKVVNRTSTTSKYASPMVATKKRSPLKFLSANYMAKEQRVKKESAKTKAASIMDLVNQKMDVPKTMVTKSLIDHKKTPVSMTATSINWLTWDEAMRKQAKEPRKIMVELYTNWCSWCVKMDKTTFKDPAIIQYINENFYAVKFDAETRTEVSFKGQKFGYIEDGSRGYNLFSLYLTRGRLTFPSIIFLDETINNPQPVKGFQNVAMMDRLLQFFGENHYKKMDWSLFNQSFESASR